MAERFRRSTLEARREHVRYVLSQKANILLFTPPYRNVDKKRTLPTGVDNSKNSGVVTAAIVRPIQRKLRIPCTAIVEQPRKFAPAGETRRGNLHA